MLKWALRIVAVSGALLALAVGTAAWMHRTEGRTWSVATPAILSDILILPKYVRLTAWRRREWDPYEYETAGRYQIVSTFWDNSDIEEYFVMDTRQGFGFEWRGFGFVHGYDFHRLQMPSYTSVLCPTWSLIAVLLLPMGLWAGIGWRQRRRVKAGHCINCGYDLRASPEKCPECGREVKASAER